MNPVKVDQRRSLGIQSERPIEQTFTNINPGTLGLPCVLSGDGAEGFTHFGMQTLLLRVIIDMSWL